MQFATTETIRSLDAAATASGTPGDVLMERAGYGAFKFMATVACPCARRIVVVAGKGNNGGDASVVARYLAASGRQVELVLLCDPAALDDAAQASFKQIEHSGVHVSVAADEAALKRVWPMLQCDVLVDGVLGTGVAGEVNGVARAAIECINAHGAPVLSLDVPSGLDSDKGTPCGAAVRAAWTVTFGHAKRAMLTAAGEEYCGRVEVVDIGLARDAGGGDGPTCLSSREVTEMLAARDLRDHKNKLGHVLVIAGSRGMTGAAVLCAQAALHTGAGLVTVAVPESLLPLVAPLVPACMTLPVPDGGLGMFTRDAVAVLFENLERFSCVAIGPGMGRHKAVDAFLHLLLMELYCPTVVDADALNHMADKPGLLAEVEGTSMVLTPHPGEFERLSGMKPTNDAIERAAMARSFAEKHGAVVLLKGFHSIVAAPGMVPCLNMTGNQGMATAGSGDVLTGMIAALLARGMSPADATRAGAFIHGLAGDVAAGIHGFNALTAPRIVESLGAAFKYVAPLG